jgi:hypothetical protein
VGRQELVDLAAETDVGDSADAEAGTNLRIGVKDSEAYWVLRMRRFGY